MNFFVATSAHCIRRRPSQILPAVGTQHFRGVQRFEDWQSESGCTVVLTALHQTDSFLAIGRQGLGWATTHAWGVVYVHSAPRCNALNTLERAALHCMGQVACGSCSHLPQCSVKALHTDSDCSQALSPEAACTAQMFLTASTPINLLLRRGLASCSCIIVALLLHYRDCPLAPRWKL